jgi:hypothetical protein
MLKAGAAIALACIYPGPAFSLFPYPPSINTGFSIYNGNKGAIILVQAEQEGPVETIPEALKRPQWGEAPRYPRDTIIGGLGRGLAGEGAYSFARNLMAALLSGNPDSDMFSALEDTFLERLTADLASIDPEKYRLGGGREEPDGSTSFLFRFIGREQSIAGELYLRLEDDIWRLEDLVFEPPRAVSEGAEGYQFDFTPYERFF